MSENPCDGFEIAIDMRRHGAAAPEVSSRLDEHLRTCPTCRSYAELGEETETRLRADAEAARRKLDVERLRARGFRIALRRWTDFGAFYLFAAAAFAFRAAAKAAGLEQGSAPADAAMAMMWAFLLYADVRRSRKEIADAWSFDTLFFSMRRDVTTRLKGSIVGGFLAVIFSAVFIADRILGFLQLRGGLLRTAFDLALGAVGLFVLAVRVPRLLREQREIPDVPDPYQHSSESFFGLR